MLAGLGRVVAEPPVHVHAYPAPQLGVLGDQRVQARVQVRAPVLQTQQPRLVVDAGRPVGDLVVGDAEQVGEVADGPVHRVAQPHDTCQPGGLGEVLDVHRHRVGVVEQPGVGAHLGDVLGERLQQREGAQRAEDAADAEGVADGLAQPVAGRDLEVGTGGLPHADLDDVDDEVRVGERRAPLGVGGDPGPGAVAVPPGALVRDELGGAARGVEPFGVDVVQGDVRAAQLGEGQQVGQEPLREHDAARADEGDLGGGEGHQSSSP